jgi:PAS domain S-box-containing protein
MARKVGGKAGGRAPVADGTGDALPELRSAAEALLAREARSNMVPRSQEHLLHEVLVHHIELEMQNEVLRETRDKLEAARERYAGLYELAPVGYLTLTEAGLIAEANLTAARMLGVERDRLLGRSFELCIAAHERDGWHLLLDGDPTRNRACELDMLRGNGDVFPALLEFRHETMGTMRPETLLTFTDVSTLKRTELALSRSDESFRRLAQISPAAILRADRAGACTYANQRCAETSGRPVGDLLGDGWLSVMHPEDRDSVMAQWRTDMSARRPQPLEWRVLRPDGSIRWVISEAAPEFDERGKVVGYISCISDVTELRQREEQRRAELEEQRNTLVREVHHRIKNNLQSVAGLLQRELGRFLELDPRLKTAISQVHAIAVVHGLQGVHPGEHIRLCDSVRNICIAVGNMTQRTVRFQIEDERTSFRPVRIDGSEAVAVALILNELILNAVKHSPRDGRDPAVSLRADGASAHLVISNAVASPPTFDLDSGASLGTGLRLVRSLLPKQGLELTYQAEAANLLLTKLRLSSPVVAQLDCRR